MKQILVIHNGEGGETSNYSFMGQALLVRRAGCGGNAERARALIQTNDGQVDAIALEGMPVTLELGGARRPHELGATLPPVAERTPVVDGSGLRAGLERWGVILADRAQPGIFAQKHVLMVPGLNHNGLAQALGRRAADLRYADPIVYFNLPAVPLVGSRGTLDQASGPTLDQLKDAAFDRLQPLPGSPPEPRDASAFAWADVLAGDIGVIRRHAPADLKHKTIVAEWATDEDLADLRERGVNILITMMPALDGRGELGRWSAATIEAIMVALRPDPTAPLSEDTYLDRWPTSTGHPPFAICNRARRALIASPSSSTPLASSSSTTTNAFAGQKHCPTAWSSPFRPAYHLSTCPASPAESRRRPASASRAISSRWEPRPGR